MALNPDAFDFLSNLSTLWSVVLGALLVMTLTSFNPVQKPEQSGIADVQTPRTKVGGARPLYRTHVYVQPPQAEAPEVYVHVDPMPVYLPPDFAERGLTLRSGLVSHPGRSGVIGTAGCRCRYPYSRGDAF